MYYNDLYKLRVWYLEVHLFICLYTCIHLVWRNSVLFSSWYSLASGLSVHPWFVIQPQALSFLGKQSQAGGQKNCCEVVIPIGVNGSCVDAWRIKDWIYCFSQRFVSTFWISLNSEAIHSLQKLCLHPLRNLMSLGQPPYMILPFAIELLPAFLSFVVRFLLLYLHQWLAALWSVQVCLPHLQPRVLLQVLVIYHPLFCHCLVHPI